MHAIRAAVKEQPLRLNRSYEPDELYSADIQSSGMLSMSEISFWKSQYREPDLLLIICANATMAYTTENGVKVIPIGCLKD